MNSVELLNKISVEDIVGLMTEHYKIDMEDTNDDKAFHFRTDCHSVHNKGSYKLYLSKDTKNFYCYTCDGKMSLFEFIMKKENLDYPRAVDFVKKHFKI